MSVAPKIIKLNSQTAGPFNANQNIVDFEIPAGMNVSLRDSYLAFNCVITSEEQGDNLTAGGDGIYPVKLEWNAGAGLKVPNISLIRDASISCERRGQIENIRHMDQLRTNLGYYSESIAAQDGNKYLDMNVYMEDMDADAQKADIFREFTKEGDAPSRNLTIAPIQISLADMFDFCKTDEFDTGRAGRTTIRTRLNLDKIVSVQTSPPTIPMDAEGLKMDGTFAIGVSSDSLTTTASYKSLEQSPFYVGQRILVDATGGFTQKSILIKAISWNNTGDGKITLTTEGNWVTTAAAELTEVLVSFVALGDANSPAISYVINYAEIVLKEVSNPKGYDEINFNTFGTEQTNGNALTSYRNIFTVEPEATNVLVLFPDAGGLISKIGAANCSYNLRLNNEDLTDNREVVWGTTLDKDRVNIGLTNMGVKPRNLQQNAGSRQPISSNRFTNAGFDLRIIAAPLRITTQQKLLQVSVDDTAGLGAITMFRELPRIFSY